MKVNVGEARFPLVAESVAMFSGIFTVTVPSAEASTSKEYVASSTVAKFATVPLDTTMSSAVKPETFLLKVASTGYAARFVGLGSVEDITTVGRTLLNVRENVAEARLAFPARSLAA